MVSVIREDSKLGEKKLYQTALDRAAIWKQRQEDSKKFAGFLTVTFPWE
ncbi:hypothetical protein [Paenibacillus sp. JJ-100]|nr:hypothetical protein [Paenibacillus sp. JJ-100]